MLYISAQVTRPDFRAARILSARSAWVLAIPACRAEQNTKSIVIVVFSAALRAIHFWLFHIIILSAW